MKKLMIYLMIIVLLLQIVFSNGGTVKTFKIEQQESEYPKFNPTNTKSWGEGSAEDWRGISRASMQSSDAAEVIKKMGEGEGDIDKLMAYWEKNEPLINPKGGEIELLVKLKPHIHRNMYVEGTVVGEEFISTPQGTIYFSDKKLSLSYTKDGLYKIEDVVIKIKGDFSIGCSEGISCIEGIGSDDKKLKIRGYGPMEVKVPDEAGYKVDAAYVNEDEDYTPSKEDRVRVYVTKDEEDVFFIEFPPNGKPVMGKINDDFDINEMETDFHTEIIGKNGKKSWDLVTQDGKKTVLVDGEVVGAHSAGESPDSFVKKMNQVGYDAEAIQEYLSNSKEIVAMDKGEYRVDVFIPEGFEFAEGKDYHILILGKDGSTIKSYYLTDEDLGKFLAYAGDEVIGEVKVVSSDSEGNRVEERVPYFSEMMDDGQVEGSEEGLGESSGTPDENQIYKYYEDRLDQYSSIDQLKIKRSIGFLKGGYYTKDIGHLDSFLYDEQFLKQNAPELWESSIKKFHRLFSEESMKAENVDNRDYRGLLSKLVQSENPELQKIGYDSVEQLYGVADKNGAHTSAIRIAALGNALEPEKHERMAKHAFGRFNDAISSALEEENEVRRHQGITKAIDNLNNDIDTYEINRELFQRYKPEIEKSMDEMFPLLSTTYKIEYASIASNLEFDSTADSYMDDVIEEIKETGNFDDAIGQAQYYGLPDEYIQRIKDAKNKGYFEITE